MLPLYLAGRAEFHDERVVARRWREGIACYDVSSVGRLLEVERPGEGAVGEAGSELEVICPLDVPVRVHFDDRATVGLSGCGTADCALPAKIAPPSEGGRVSFNGGEQG